LEVMPTLRDFAATHHLAVGSTGAGSVALAGLGPSMGTAQAFDRQPDPPGKVAPSHRVNPGEIHGSTLNLSRPACRHRWPSEVDSSALATRTVRVMDQWTRDSLAITRTFDARVAG
jgi:hypothetical protein